MLAAMSYSVREQESSMAVESIQGSGSQSYIFTNGDTKPVSPQSCTEHDNPTCNKTASDSYLWGLAGVGAGVVLLLVIQYMVSDDHHMFVMVSIHVLVAAFVVTSAVNIGMLEAQFMGITDHVKQDFEDFLSNSSTVIDFNTDIANERYWSYAARDITCDRGAGIVWAWVSFVAAAFLAIIHFGDSFLGWAVSDFNPGKGPSSRPPARLLAFLLVVVFVAAATMCGIAGTKEDYGSYTQDNIGANMKTDDFLKCHFNNKWDISKQGVLFSMSGAPLNGTNVQPTMFEIQERISAVSYNRDFSMWMEETAVMTPQIADSNGPDRIAPAKTTAFAFYYAFVDYIANHFGTRSLDAVHEFDTRSQLTFAAYLHPDVPTSVTDDEGGCAGIKLTPATGPAAGVATQTKMYNDKDMGPICALKNDPTPYAGLFSANEAGNEETFRCPDGCATRTTAGKGGDAIYAVPAANKKAMKCYHDTLVTEADTPEDDTTTKVMCRTTQPFTTKFETKTYGPNKDKYTHWVTLTRAGPAGLTPQIAEATQQQSSEDLIEMVAAATTLSYNNHYGGEQFLTVAGVAKPNTNLGCGTVVTDAVTGATTVVPFDDLGGNFDAAAGTNQGLKTGAGVIFAPIQMDLGPDGDNPICIKENSQRPTDTELVGQQATPGVVADQAQLAGGGVATTLVMRQSAVAMCPHDCEATTANERAKFKVKFFCKNTYAAFDSLVEVCSNTGSFEEMRTQPVMDILRDYVVPLVKLSNATASANYRLKSAIANLGPGDRGQNPPECSAWNHNIDVNTKFDWQGCKEIKEDMNGDDCMASACDTRHMDMWYGVLAFMVLPVSLAILWAYNWSITATPTETLMTGKTVAILVALVAFVPLLVLLGLLAWKYPMSGAGDNDCQGDALAYFQGESADNDYEDHSGARAGIVWEQADNRTGVLQASFILYILAMCGTFGLIFTTAGKGIGFGTSMSAAEHQTGRFVRLTPGL
jgi:hypothetical protein